jgi:hypothetical protein
LERQRLHVQGGQGLYIKVREHTNLTVLFLVGTLIAPAFGQGDSPDDFKSAPSDRVGLRVDLLSERGSFIQGRSDWDGGQNGLDNWGFVTTIGDVRVVWNRFRYGMALYEDIMGWSAFSFLPLKLGYTIWNHPINYVWRVQGMMPEVSTELTAYWLNEGPDDYDRVPISGRADVVVGADAFGAGLSLSAGVIYIQTLDGHSGHNQWRESHGFSPSIEVRLRLGTAAFNLSED